MDDRIMNFCTHLKEYGGRGDFSVKTANPSLVNMTHKWHPLNRNVRAVVMTTRSSRPLFWMTSHVLLNGSPTKSSLTTCHFILTAFSASQLHDYFIPQLIPREQAMKFPEWFYCASYMEPYDLILVEISLCVCQLAPVNDFNALTQAVWKLWRWYEAFLRLLAKMSDRFFGLRNQH
jgi:hypothetical protein